MSMDEEESLIKWLVDLGILRDLGYNEIFGDHIYQIDDTANDFIPGLKEQHRLDVNQAVFDLWNLEMIDIRFDDDGEPLISLNENSTNTDKINSIEDEALRSQMLLLISIFNERFK